jgi:hypothetical protein
VLGVLGEHLVVGLVVVREPLEEVLSLALSRLLVAVQGTLLGVMVALVVQEVGEEDSSLHTLLVVVLLFREPAAVEETLLLEVVLLELGVGVEVLEQPVQPLLLQRLLVTGATDWHLRSLVLLSLVVEAEGAETEQPQGQGEPEGAETVGAQELTTATLEQPTQAVGVEEPQLMLELLTVELGVQVLSSSLSPQGQAFPSVWV